MFAAKSTLEVLLEPYHFQDGLLVAKCIASMFTMHWQSSDIKIKEESPTLASVVDHSNGSKNATNAAPKTETETSKKNSKKSTPSVGGTFNIPVTSGSVTRGNT